MKPNQIPRKSEPAPAPRSVRSVPRYDPSEVDADIAAAVEAQLAAQRAEITAKLVAEKAEQRRKAEEKRRAEERAAAAAAAAAVEAKKTARASVLPPTATEYSVEELTKFQQMLRASGAVVLQRAESDSDDDSSSGGRDDYSDTERVQVELNALLDLLGVVRVKDVIEHVRRDDGEVMSPSNVRYHMRKLSNKGVVKKVEERYYIKALGWRTRDAWSKDPQKLLEILEGKKTVRS